MPPVESARPDGQPPHRQPPSLLPSLGAVVLLFVLGLVLGVFGALLIPAGPRIGSVLLSVGVAVALIGNVVAGVLGTEMTGNRLGAIVPAHRLGGGGAPARREAAGRRSHRHRRHQGVRVPAGRAARRRRRRRTRSTLGGPPPIDLPWRFWTTAGQRTAEIAGISALLARAGGARLHRPGRPGRRGAAHARADPGARTARTGCQGVANVRGQVLAVVDLRPLLGVAAGHESPSVPGLLRVDADGIEVGLRVDAVDGVADLDLDESEPLPPGAAAPDLFAGVITVGRGTAAAARRAARWSRCATGWCERLHPGLPRADVARRGHPA